MVINALTSGNYQCPFRAPHSVHKMHYNDLQWRNGWYVFLRIMNKEQKALQLGEITYEKAYITHIIRWFDNNILQAFEAKPYSRSSTNIPTLNVRLRIVCGMVNKIPQTKLNRNLKIEFLECIWDAFYKFRSCWFDHYYINICDLPF